MIIFPCDCGKVYTVPEEFAGRQTTCRECRAPLRVPELEVRLVDVADMKLADEAPRRLKTPREAKVLDEVVEGVQEIDDVEVIDDAPAAGVANTTKAAAAPAPHDTLDLVLDAEPEAAESDEVLEEGELVEEGEADSGPPRYFMVAYDGSHSMVHASRVFRVYADGEELLFVHAGPFNWAAVDALLGPAHIGATAARTGAVHGVEAGLAVGLLGSLAMALTSVIDARRLKQRAALLDPMTLDQLRAEAATDKSSFRVTRDNVAEARIEPPSTSIWANKNIEAKILGRLTFRHDPTGKWTFLLLTRSDARAAIRAMRRVLGRDQIDVKLRLKKRRR